MREIRRNSWHFWLFALWWGTKDEFRVVKKTLPERIGLCEYVRGILLGVLALPVALAIFLCVFAVVAVCYAIGSAFLLVFCGTIVNPVELYKRGNWESWVGRYQLAIRLPRVTIYPWQILVLVGSIWVLTRFPTARHAVAIIVALAALCYGSYRGWKSLRESDTYQLAAGYAKAIKDQACPVLTIVDDSSENARG